MRLLYLAGHPAFITTDIEHANVGVLASAEQFTR